MYGLTKPDKSVLPCSYHFTHSHDVLISSGGAGQGMGSLRDGLPSKPKKRPSSAAQLDTGSLKGPRTYYPLR